MSHRYSISRSPIQGVLYTSDHLSLPRKKQEKEKKQKKKQTKSPLLDRELLDRSSPEASTPHSNSIHLLRFDRSKQASKPRCFKLYSTLSLSPHRQHTSNTHLHSKLQQSKSKNKTQHTSSSPFFSSSSSSSSPSLPKSPEKMKKNGQKKKLREHYCPPFLVRSPLLSTTGFLPAPPSRALSRSLSLSLSLSRRQLRSYSIPARTQLHKAWCAV